MSKSPNRPLLLGSALLSVSGSALALVPMQGGYMQEGSTAPQTSVAADFSRIDSAHRGQVTREQYRAAHLSDAEFDAADSNHDGLVTRAEFAAAQSQMPDTGKPSAEMACGEGKCGATMPARSAPAKAPASGTKAPARVKSAEMKCGEGKCGAKPGSKTP